MYKVTIYLKHGLEPVVVEPVAEKTANGLIKWELGAPGFGYIAHPKTGSNYNFAKSSIVYIHVKALED